MNVWNLSPAQPNLPADEVHVWRASLDQPDLVLAQLAGTLSADERARADRLHVARVKQRFIAGRGFLRAVLAGYLACKPAEPRFTYGEQGKPALADNGSALQFNLSHSGELALLAVTRNRRVGVDVEQHRARANADRIARRFFSRNEWEELEALPPNQRDLAFFACWTRKEAYVKALGEGISAGLANFEVTVNPNEPPRLLRVVGDADAPGRWQLAALSPGAGYSAGVAAEGTGWRLRCFEWTAIAGG